MAGGGEARHVDADLRHDDLGHEVTDPGHGRQQAGALLDRRQGFSHGGIELAERAFERGDQLEVQLEHRAVMRGDAAAQRLDQGAALAPGGALRQRGQRSGSLSPAMMAPSMARPEAVSTSESTLPSLRLASSSTFWMRRECWEISRTSCLRVRVRSRSSWIGGGRHEAGADQAVREQIGEPHRIVDVGLAAGDVADVLGVGQHQLEVRLPAHARPAASRRPWPPSPRGCSRARQATRQARAARASWSRSCGSHDGWAATRSARRPPRCPCARPGRHSADRALAWVILLVAAAPGGALVIEIY